MKELSFKDYYSQKLNQFETYLKTSFPELPQLASVLEESIKYSLFAGGKRLRPILLMTTVECGSKDPSISLPIACAIEYIHTYSLIHDDLPCMDDDELRRGNPTNHIKFGEAIALLAGDSLLTHSFSLIGSMNFDSVSPEKLLKIINLLAEKAGIYGMVSGQVADISDSIDGKPAQKLKFIHSHKTGALITASVQIGAILADCSNDDFGLLTKFGEEIGKCFQIQDDVLDETGDKTLLGKTPGSDMRNDTLTYPKIYGLEESVSLANKSYEQALEYLGDMTGDVHRLRQLAGFILKRDH